MRAVTNGTVTAFPISILLSLILAVFVSAQPTLRTDDATFEIGPTGLLVAISHNGQNLIAANQAAPLLQVRAGGKDHQPESATWHTASGKLTLTYPGGLKAVVKITAKPTHVTLELVETDTAKVDLVRWGPYPITLNRVIGEMVGVVRDTETAVGIQALNAKTQGGEPCGDDFQEHR